MPTAAPPTGVPLATLGDVIWASGVTETGEPEDSLTALARDAPVIHAVVEATNLSAGETLVATWSMNGAAIDGIEAAVTIDDETSAGWVSFALTWEGDALWPTGTLGITITASTGATTSGEITIVSDQ